VHVQKRPIDINDLPASAGTAPTPTDAQEPDVADVKAGLGTGSPHEKATGIPPFTSGKRLTGSSGDPGI